MFDRFIKITEIDPVLLEKNRNLFVGKPFFYWIIASTFCFKFCFHRFIQKFVFLATLYKMEVNILISYLSFFSTPNCCIFMTEVEALRIFDSVGLYPIFVVNFGTKFAFTTNPWHLDMIISVFFVYSASNQSKVPYTWRNVNRFYGTIDSIQTIHHSHEIKTIFSQVYWFSTIQCHVCMGGGDIRIRFPHKQIDLL